MFLFPDPVFIISSQCQFSFLSVQRQAFINQSMGFLRHILGCKNDLYSTLHSHVIPSCRGNIDSVNGTPHATLTPAAVNRCVDGQSLDSSITNLWCDSRGGGGGRNEGLARECSQLSKELAYKLKITTKLTFTPVRHHIRNQIPPPPIFKM